MILVIILKLLKVSWVPQIILTFFGYFNLNIYYFSFESGLNNVL